MREEKASLSIKIDIINRACLFIIVYLWRKGGRGGGQPTLVIPQAAGCLVWVPVAWPRPILGCLLILYRSSCTRPPEREEHLTRDATPAACERDRSPSTRATSTGRSAINTEHVNLCPWTPHILNLHTRFASIARRSAQSGSK